ncbi:MAG: vWA domain-containing protein [Planctomycetota bacterium]|jgi:hypothetical protein
MRRLLTFAAICGLWLPARAGDLGIAEIFDPFCPAFPVTGERLKLKKQEFDRAEGRVSVPALVKHLRRFEPALEEIQKRIDKTYAAYEESGKRYWGWRARYARDYEKKHGRPAAQFDVPPAINKDYLDKEKAFRAARSIKLRERFFHAHVLERMSERIAGQSEKERQRSIAALAGGLRDRSPEQRLRCTHLLVSLEDSEDAGKVLELAYPAEKKPAIAGEMVLTVPSGALAAILEQRGPWQLRAGAALALSGRRTRESVALLVAAIQKEEGRLLDDYCDALQGLTAQTTGCDPKAWQDWWGRCGEDWQPAALAAGAEDEEDDRLNPPSVFSDGPVECFGIPTSSRRIVYCVDGSVPSWKFASEEVGRSIGSLPDEALFGLVICGEAPVRFKKKLLAANGSNRKAAVRRLERFKPSGRADVCEGLLQALSMAGVDTVYLFTLRGGTWGRFTDPAQTAQEITAANRLLGVRIHAVGVSAGRDAYYLQTIARQFGGTFKPLR